MGLDMYLTRDVYVGANYAHREVKGNIELSIKGKNIPIKLEAISDITLRAAYWRKANHIHKWFVNNVQDGKDDCKKYFVPVAKLKELIGICKRVIEHPELAPQLLPTQEGFFFGSTDYNEYYYQHCQDTIDQLSRWDLDEDENNYEISYYYESSW
jgi:hypothetical protein